MPLHKKGDKRLLRAWASYDWANSVYFLVISSAIFPLYYGYICADETHLEVFGMSFKNTALISYVTALAFMFIAIWSPILSGIADYMGNKKRFMQFFTYLGSLSCIGLYFFTGENVEYGIACSVLASIGYAGSLVFYNGFLPEVTSNEFMEDHEVTVGVEFGTLSMQIEDIKIKLQIWDTAGQENF